MASVREEGGRWTVFVRTEGWASADGPFEVVEARIQDYPTRRAAEVAAGWIQRTANKRSDPPEPDPGEGTAPAGREPGA